MLKHKNEHFKILILMQSMIHFCRIYLPLERFKSLAGTSQSQLARKVTLPPLLALFSITALGFVLLRNLYLTNIFIFRNLTPITLTNSFS